MPLLSNREASDVTDAFLVTLYGDNTFTRWRELKGRMQFFNEREYVGWLLDVAEHYEAEDASAVKHQALHVKAEGDVESSYASNTTPDPTQITEVQSVSRHSDKVLGDRYGVVWKDADAAHHPQQQLTSAKAKHAVEGQSTEPLHHISPAAPVMPEPPTYYEEITVSSDCSNTTLANKNMESSDLVDNDDASDGDDDMAGAAPDTDNEYVSTVSTDGLSSASHHRNTCIGDTLQQEPAAPRQQLGAVIKRHSCQYCAYSTNSLSDKTKHVRAVHERVKPYSCSHCAYSASRMDNLRQHLINQHRYNTKYTCERCGKPFAAPSALSTHQGRCTGSAASTASSTAAAHWNPNKLI